MTTPETNNERSREADGSAFVLGKSTASEMLRHLRATSHVVYVMSATIHYHGALDIVCRLWPNSTNDTTSHDQQ